MMRRILFFIFFAALIASCEKDQHLAGWNSDVPLLTKVLIDGESSNEYTYTNADLVSEEKSKFFYTRHTYDSKGLVTKSEYYIDPGIFSSSYEVLQQSLKRKEWVNSYNTQKSLTKTYEYTDNGQLYRIKFIRPSVDNSEYSLFTWEGDRITRQTMYWQNAISGYIDYVYDDRGNLGQETKYRVPASTGIAELETTTGYEYDSMGNPFRSFRGLMIPGKHTNLNNITKQTYTIHFEVDQSVQKVTFTEYSYEYNPDGYPVRVNGEAEYRYE